jgi:hypothetical protein
MNLPVFESLLTREFLFEKGIENLSLRVVKFGGLVGGFKLTIEFCCQIQAKGF